MEQAGYDQRIQETLVNYILALVEKAIVVGCECSGVNKSALTAALAERFRHMSTIAWAESGKPVFSAMKIPIPSRENGEAKVAEAMPGLQAEEKRDTGPNPLTSLSDRSALMLTALKHLQPISTSKLIAFLIKEYPEVNHKGWVGIVTGRRRKGIIRQGRDKLLRLRP